MPYRKTIPSHPPQLRPGIGRYRRSAAAEPGLAGKDDAATPFASSASPAAEPGSASAAPVARDDASRSTHWQAIQSMFVDDPRSSPELAAGLVDESVEALVMSVKEQQHSLLSAWQGDDPGTEDRNCARHSSSPGHSGTVSKISPVKPDHPPLAAKCSSSARVTK